MTNDDCNERTNEPSTISQELVSTDPGDSDPQRKTIQIYKNAEEKKEKEITVIIKNRDNSNKAPTFPIPPKKTPAKAKPHNPGRIINKRHNDDDEYYQHVKKLNEERTKNQLLKSPNLNASRNEGGGQG